MLYWLLGIISGILLLLLVTGAVFFYIGIVRWRRRHKTVIDQDTTDVWSKYRDEMRAGRDWFVAQEREEITLTSYDGLKLYAEYLPAQDPKGIVILFHGYRSSAHNDFSCVFRYYHERGYDILCVTQRSHGKSEGRYICFGVKERYDCRQWVEYVCSRFGEDVDIFLDGISMGATTVLMAAGLGLPDNVRGIIADCGFTSPWDEFEAVLKRSFRLRVHPLMDVAQLYAKLFAGFTFKECSTLDAMRVNKIPVLFAHGADDDFVPTHMSVDNYEACASEKVLIIVEGAVHGESYLVDRDRYQRELENFFEKYSTKNK